MATCEKCWKDAHLMELSNPEKTRGEYYIQLLEERYNNPCNAEAQAGENSSYCNRCERAAWKEIYMYKELHFQMQNGKHTLNFEIRTKNLNILRDGK